MAKKTRTELSTLAINTNLPDNTTELITPTTERSQLTDERESVVNYKDDLGGVSNAGKFITVAGDGESLTMVDEPSGVPAWVTFATGLSNLMKLLSGTNNVQIQFFYDVAGVDTLGAKISFDAGGKGLLIGNDYYTANLSISNQFNFSQGGFVKLRIEATGDLTHNADIMALNAQQAFGSNPLYTFKFQGKVTGPSGGSYTFEEFANIKGGKENATENDKAGYLSFETAIADGTLTERLRISSGGDATFSGNILANGGEIFSKISSGSTAAVVKIGSGATWQLRSNPITGTNSYGFDIIKGGAGTDVKMSITSGGVINSYYGIAFPNQSAGSGTVASSTLDAYEEGTWTPTIQDQSGHAATLNATSSVGVYTRIGNVVYWRVNAIMTTKPAAMVSGEDVRLYGFPYASSAIPDAFYRPSTIHPRRITFSGSISINVVTAQSFAIFLSASSGSVGGTVPISGLVSNSTISATGFYTI